ncbi:hypothetical protein BACSP_00221 [Bacillus sp. T2.9-1]|nr:hypothetical protein BACSP_00221 [Bacillus sp. T2.9-1]
MERFLPELNSVLVIEYAIYTNSTTSEWEILS